MGFQTSQRPRDRLEVYEAWGFGRWHGWSRHFRWRGCRSGVCHRSRIACS
ncbi:hypothetical protein F442_08200 [Phytophthora nicotianae P10297]|uniref:Uncharacterized protein n=1 Tax=Phytophthora nicotianae P10297 TaxID=1317064 RepID=W2ZDM0_PHYNI|nr:hypothetical protein F442_08200 [Phytophthora nicotianae P10297]